MAFMGLRSSRHYLALDTSHRPVTPHPHRSSKTMVVPLVQGALYFLRQRLVRKQTFLRRRSGCRPPPIYRVRATLLHFNQHAASSKAAPTHRPNKARNRALAKERSYNCGHRAQGRRALGRAWRRVDPRWQVDLQHPRNPSGGGVPGCNCRPHRSAGADSNQEQLGQCQQDLPGARKNLRPR